MKKTLLLLAGYPGTGKTYFGNMFLEDQDGFHFVSQDIIKEECFDRYGFDDLSEKKAVIEISRKEYYEQIEEYMKKGLSVITDYPFSYKQKPVFEELANKYDFQIITVRFIGEIEQIYQRQRNRDLDPSRHLGHIAISYHAGQTTKDRTKQEDLITFEKFVARGNDRGYETFELGHLIELDTTDFSKVNYPEVINKLKKLVK